jgi:addiction module HigA family antidote
MKRRMLREPTRPGQILQEEFLEPLGISQTALARHTGWTQPKVSEIVRGDRGITPETAMVLADAFNTTPEFWLNLQRAVDLWRAEQKHKKVKSLVGSR